MRFVRRMLKKRKLPSFPSTGIKTAIAMFEETITGTVCRYGVILCKRKENSPCHLLFYCTSYRLNMFRWLLLPFIRSSRLWCWLSHWSCRSWFAVMLEVRCSLAGVVSGLLGSSTCLSLQPGQHSNLTVPNLQHTANQERHDQCDNQHHSRELLMMGIVILETSWAYRKYNKITSGV